MDMKEMADAAFEISTRNAKNEYWKKKIQQTDADVMDKLKILEKSLGHVTQH
jgi:hypothetical protein